MEMLFIDVEDILDLNEKMFCYIWKEIKGIDVLKFQCMSYFEVMDCYGSDKLDICFGFEICDLFEVVQGLGFKVFDDVFFCGGIVCGLNILGGFFFLCGQFDKLIDLVKKNGVKGLVWMKQDVDGVISFLVFKFISVDKLKVIFMQFGCI